MLTTQNVVDLDEHRVAIFLAEYEFATSLIRYYRELELRALAATGLLLTAVAAAVAAIESAEEPNRMAEALLLAIAAWIPVVLLKVVLIAKARGSRAVLEIREILPERLTTLRTYGNLLGGGHTGNNLVGRYVAKPNPAWWRRAISPVMTANAVERLLRGTPILDSLMACSLALTTGAAGIALTSVDQPVGKWISLGIGLAATFAAFPAWRTGIAFTNATDAQPER
jgi:hypothetical protein